MKKFVAIVLTLIMAFSVAAIPASAADAEVKENISASEAIDNDVKETIDSAKDIYNEVVEKDFFGTLESICDFAEDLATAIHTIIHSFAKLFNFDCPFCTDAPVVDDAPLTEVF